MKRKPVDIIIAAEYIGQELETCIRSVEENTDLTFDALTLICTHDKREELNLCLRRLHEDNALSTESNVRVLNDSSRELTDSENRDIILLDGNAVVTNNWLDKISFCAYSNAKTGMVTPISNVIAPYLNSVLYKNKEKAMRQSVDECSHMIERCSMRKYPRYKGMSAVCLFIKGEAVQEAGIFDMEPLEWNDRTENDICNRMEQYGYMHVLCDDTFIFRKTEADSFDEVTGEVMPVCDRGLMERYPRQMEQRLQYYKTNPNRFIWENINIYASANPKKRNLMYVIHSDFRSDAMDNMGGTQFHVRDLTCELKEEFNVYVAARDRNHLRVTMYSGDNIVSLKYDIGEINLYPPERDAELYHLFSNLLKAFRIDVLHVHHTYGLSFDMIYAAHDLQIPVVLTMHDYYYVCPNVKLVNPNLVQCEGYRESDQCSICLAERAGITIGDKFLIKWRNMCRRMFTLCERIILPSESAKQMVGLYYPDIVDQLMVIEHGLELRKNTTCFLTEDITESSQVHVSWDCVFDDPVNPYRIYGWAYIEEIDSNDVVPYLEITIAQRRFYQECVKIARKDVVDYEQEDNYLFCGFSCNVTDDTITNQEVSLRLILKYGNQYYTHADTIKRCVKEIEVTEGINVAFLGGMLSEKGSKKAYQMISHLKSDVNWHIFGTIADADLIDMQQDNLYKHGAYVQSDLPFLLQQYAIDVVCILPIWSETFCYTISEAVACGIPVFVTDIGAVGERVKKNGYGWTVPVHTSGSDMADLLLQYFNNRDDYEEKKRKAVHYKDLGLDEMAQKYAGIYNELFQSKSERPDFDRELIFRGTGIPMVTTWREKSEWKEQNIRYEVSYEARKALEQQEIEKAERERQEQEKRNKNLLRKIKHRLLG